MSYSNQDRLIALAGIYQAALCVRQISHRGTVDTETMEPCIYSLFQTESDNAAAVFGAAGNLTAGTRELVGQLTGKQPKELELTRYVISLLKLERVLAGRKEMVAEIADGIEAARAKLEHFPMLHPNLLAHLADIYSRTVSQLQPRIMVRGEPVYLQNPENQNRIRTLLLAGIRAAWLWRQLGGSRWQILFGRKRLLDTARDYLRVSQH
ncbi:MAG: high frequency lysogenization protein HflD [Pseudomonadota bacterium]|nr:high frequency lysogenization protein HflD [Pseudomonadota bacterium]